MCFLLSDQSYFRKKLQLCSNYKQLTQCKMQNQHEQAFYFTFYSIIYLISIQQQIRQPEEATRDGNVKAKCYALFFASVRKKVVVSVFNQNKIFLFEMLAVTHKNFFESYLPFWRYQSGPVNSKKDRFQSTGNPQIQNLNKALVETYGLPQITSN